MSDPIILSITISVTRGGYGAKDLASSEMKLETPSLAASQFAAFAKLVADDASEQFNASMDAERSEARATVELAAVAAAMPPAPAPRVPFGVGAEDDQNPFA